VARASVQGNDPARAASIVAESGARAHPDDLGVDRDVFTSVLLGLRDYARAEQLDVGIADVRQLTTADADEAWVWATSLPRG
jgi:hypothetical protein